MEKPLSNNDNMSNNIDANISNNIDDNIDAMISSVQKQKTETTKTRGRFRRLGQIYSSAHGSYTAWKTDVNLDQPASLGRQIPEDSKFAHEYYTALQYTLFETGYPETVDRTDSPISGLTDEGVTVVVLSSPVECIGLLLEGGKQCPDAFVQILSASWVKKVPCSDSSYNLFVHKGITFGRGGATYIDEYDPPRKCTYLLNFFTGTITGGQRNDGIEIEKDLECPMSSSVELAAKIDDKVWTTCIMAEVGMGFPELLAFRYRPGTAAPEPKDNRIRIVDIEDKMKGYETVAEQVEDFLSQPFMENIGKMVVKPSGSMFYGSIGVSIHPRENLEDIVKAAINLLHDLEPDCSILVEAFIEPLRARDTGNIRTEFHSQEFGFRCRANVGRDHADRPNMTLITCGVNVKSAPINGDNTVHQSLDSTLRCFGVVNPEERQLLHEEIAEKCEALMQYIIDDEVKHQDNRRHRAMTDIIGIDMVIVDTPDGGLSFKGIEVNSHDCIINCHVLEFVNALVGKEPECFETNVETMVVRSQKFIMEGTPILMIGSGGFSKRNIYRDAKKNGYKVIIVDSVPPHEEAIDSIYKFIEYDCTDHTMDQIHARNIANLLRAEGLEVDGCMTFWEDCVPLAAAVSEILETNGNAFEAAYNAKTKSQTCKILSQRDADIPHWPRTYHYVCKAQTIACSKDLEGIEDRVIFPCILKLEHGSSAVGVTLCRTKKEIVSQYYLLNNVLTNEEDFPGIGLGFGNDCMVMNYWEGSEHDIDIAIFNRKLVTAIVTDNGPTRDNRKSFAETSACMPSLLPLDKKAQLVAAAYQCCTEVGLTNGVFNVEMKMTARGPRLIEINARMGGFYIREWIQYLYGIDMAAIAMMIACDIKPFVCKERPRSTIVGIMLIPSAHADILNSEEKLNQFRSMHEKGEILFTEFTEHNTETSDIFEEPMANVAVVGKNVKECKQRMREICHRYDITTDDYNVESFIEAFI